MTIRRVQLEAPLTPASRVALADGSVTTVAEVLAMSPAARQEQVPDPTLRGEVERLSDGALVLPGADRWHQRVAVARPADPVWVPALERNARMVQLELARDALSDPWSPSRVLHDLNVLGAASQDWKGGDVAFDIQMLQPPSADGIPRFALARYQLRERDRRHLWEHLTGLVMAMEIRPGQVAASDGADGFWPAGQTPVSTVGMVGPGVAASYAYDGDDAQSARIREDGAFRRDQQERTAVAEANATLLRRHATAAGVPYVYDLPSMDSYDQAGGCDDLALRVRRSGRLWLAAGVGTAVAVGGVAASRSDSVRRWFSERWGHARALTEGM